jgi:hypothetical protein
MTELNDLIDPVVTDKLNFSTPAAREVRQPVRNKRAYGKLILRVAQRLLTGQATSAVFTQLNAIGLELALVGYRAGQESGVSG